MVIIPFDYDSLFGFQKSSISWKLKMSKMTVSYSVSVQSIKAIFCKAQLKLELWPKNCRDKKEIKKYGTGYKNFSTTIHHKREKSKSIILWIHQAFHRTSNNFLTIFTANFYTITRPQIHFYWNNNRHRFYGMSGFMVKIVRLWT